METKDNPYFYKKITPEVEANSTFIPVLAEFAEEHKTQIYVLSAPLTDNKYSYDYDKGYFVLLPKRRIIFITTEVINETDEADLTDTDFYMYIDDVLEDITSIADKYNFKELLGRSRQWKKQLIKVYNREPQDNEFDFKEFHLDSSDYRRVDLLISLIIGSINDVVGLSLDKPKDLLEEIRQKIVLFDTDQTRFIYDSFDRLEKRIRIQGLSGTGKTELLLHKLKDAYSESSESKIFFTCHNKVLADTLRKRIPEFFNRMKVQTQIEWNERLWCKNAWGSFSDPDSGLLSYICNFYEVSFVGLRDVGNFERACEYVKERLEKKGSIMPAFTYLFIDEAQDFGENMFSLCEMVTEKKVIIAGDTFQNIFNRPSDDNEKVDYVLNKCYRTDPKTLMIAQALGMGLFEKTKLWWLEDKDWKSCGYNVNSIEDDYIELTREPVRRFEDLEEDYLSFELIKTSNYQNAIKTKISELQKLYPSISPSDVGIIYLDNMQYIYSDSVVLREMIEQNFNWSTNLAYETKQLDKNAVFVSNRNNVKGLEFPFVFCITSKIENNYSYRNALYTMVSRSFLKTFLICPNNTTEDADIIDGINRTLRENKMVVKRPKKEEADEILRRFEVENTDKTLRERIESICFTNEVQYSVTEILRTAESNEINLKRLSGTELESAVLKIVEVIGLKNV